MFKALPSSTAKVGELRGEDLGTASDVYFCFCDDIDLSAVVTVRPAGR